VNLSKIILFAAGILAFIAFAALVILFPGWRGITDALFMASIMFICFGIVAWMNQDLVERIKKLEDK
jgi:hypothetical protein